MACDQKIGPERQEPAAEGTHQEDGRNGIRGESEGKTETEGESGGGREGDERKKRRDRWRGELAADRQSGRWERTTAESR